MRKMPCVIVLVVALFTAACASQGKRVEMPFTMPDGEKATIVAHNQLVPNWMIDSDTYGLNYIMSGGKEQTEKQYAAVNETERVCREFTTVVHPHDAVTVLVATLMFGGAGAAGGGIGALAFPGAIIGHYAMYSAASGGLFGGAWGALTLGSKIYTFENCGREVMSRYPRYGIQVLLKSP